MEQPLVSMSVGCEAVFLIGGLDRESPPTALLLRSGDVLIMSGAPDNAKDEQPQA